MNRVNNLFESSKTKKELMIDSIQKWFDFVWHSWIKLVFEPIRTVNNQYVIWYLRKKQKISLSKKHENLKFTEELVESWPKSIMIINCDDDSNTWQTIAIEQKSFIFRDPPLAHLEYMFKKINGKLLNEWYMVQVEPIVESNAFRKTVESVTKKNGKIYSVEFSLNMPNLFGINNSLDEDLKWIQESYGATKAVLKLSNESDWLNLPDEDEFLKQSASYTERGWWNYKIWLKWRYIKSDKKTKWEDVEFSLDIESVDEESLYLILNKIFD